MNPNETGTIYFGTRIENMALLDRAGITRPIRKKREAWISVSVSGYMAEVRYTVHRDLRLIAAAYIKADHAVDRGGFLHFKPGYLHSMTAIEGFGPGVDRPISVFDDHRREFRNHTNVAAVVPREFAGSLRRPPADKEIDGVPQEYYSLALHPFIAAIEPDMIAGWIVGPEKVDAIRKAMESGKLALRTIWEVTSLRL